MPVSSPSSGSSSSGTPSVCGRGLSLRRPSSVHIERFELTDADRALLRGGMGGGDILRDEPDAGLSPLPWLMHVVLVPVLPLVERRASKALRPSRTERVKLRSSVTSPSPPRSSARPPLRLLSSPSLPISLGETVQNAASSSPPPSERKLACAAAARRGGLWRWKSENLPFLSGVGLSGGVPGPFTELTLFQALRSDIVSSRLVRALAAAWS